MSVTSIDPAASGVPKLKRRARPPAFAPADKVPIQSVVRAFSVLEVLAGHPSGLRLADLSRLVGMHKATVFRLVRTMMLLGYVAQTAEGEPYRASELSIGERASGWKGRGPGPI